MMDRSFWNQMWSPTMFLLGWRIIRLLFYLFLIYFLSVLLTSLFLENIVFVNTSLNAYFLNFWIQDGKVQPFKKSEPIPEVNNEPVKVVVADSLDDIVFNSKKNGIVLSFILCLIVFLPKNQMPCLIISLCFEFCYVNM